MIMNEREWVENALRECRLGSKPYRTISLLAKYYHSLGYKQRDIVVNIEKFMIRCERDISIVQWQDAIESAVKSAQKYPLVELDGVTVTKSEMDKVNALPTKSLRKLMFTLLCVAKYRNAANGNAGSWVNCEQREIFALANIKVTNRRQALMVNDLWQAGYIKYSKIVDNVNINVLIVDDDSETMYVVREMADLGNQYLLASGDNYFACPCCGAVVKRMSGAQKYCKSCAKDVHRERSLNRYYGVAT